MANKDKVHWGFKQGMFYWKKAAQAKKTDLVKFVRLDVGWRSVAMVGLVLFFGEFFHFLFEIFVDPLFNLFGRLVVDLIQHVVDVRVVK